MPASPALKVPDERTAQRPAETSFLSRLWPVSGASQDIASLDGIRACALLITVVDHLLLSSFHTEYVNQADLDLLRSTQPWWENCRSGVQLFFVLSGFLLFMPYAKTLLGLRPFPETGKYYTRRALRILPAYWLSLVIIYLFFEPYHFGVDPTVDFGLHALMLHGWSTSSFYSVNSPYWTMAVESHFYLLLPLLSWIIIKLSRSASFRKPGFALLGAFLLVGHPILNTLFLRVPALSEHRTILEVFQHLSAFAVGMACSTLYIAVSEGKGIGISKERLAELSRLAGILGLAGLAVYYTAIGFPALRVLGKQPLFGPIGAACYGGILLGTLFGFPSWQRIMSAPWLRFIGVISYSMYIWNVPIFDKIIWPIAGRASVPLCFALGAILIVVALVPLSYLSYQLIERPFLRARRAQR